MTTISFLILMWTW